MNIPARYCTGYLGDIGVPPPHGTSDFAAWFETFLGGRWYAFDARNNEPRLGRVLIARGREEERKTAGGIVIPDTAAEKPSMGEVSTPGQARPTTETVRTNIPVSAIPDWRRRLNA